MLLPFVGGGVNSPRREVDSSSPRLDPAGRRELPWARLRVARISASVKGREAVQAARDIVCVF